MRHAFATGLNKGIPGLNAGKIGRMNGKSKPLLQFSMNGDLVGRWESVEIAAKSFGCRPAHIAKVSRTLQGTAQGFLWAYEKLEHRRTNAIPMYLRNALSE